MSESRPAPPSDGADARPPSGWARLRRYLTPWNVITLVILVWAAPRLLPHVGALVGLESGPGTTPQYAYVGLDGRTLSADSLRGKVVLVNFWATWCTPCRVEMPLLDAMHRRHEADGFVVLGLAVDRASTEAVARYVRERGVTYPVAHVDAAAERVFGGVRGYPTSFLIDRSGRIRHTVLGPVAPLSLEPAVRRLLDEATGP